MPHYMSNRPLEHYQYSQKICPRGIDGSSVDLYRQYAKHRGVDSKQLNQTSERLDLDVQIARGNQKLPPGKVAFVIHPRDMELLPLSQTSALGGNALLRLPFGPGTELREISRRNGKFADVQHHFSGLELLSHAEQVAVYARHPFSLHAAYTNNEDGKILGYVISSSMLLGELAAIRGQNFHKQKSIEAVANYVNSRLISDIYTAIEAGILTSDSIIGLSMTLPGPTDYGRTLKESLNINCVTGHELTSYFVDQTVTRVSQELTNKSSADSRVGLIGAGVIAWAIADQIARTQHARGLIIHDKNPQKATHLAQEMESKYGIPTQTTPSIPELMALVPLAITATNNLSPLYRIEEFKEGKDIYRTAVIEDSQPTLFHRAKFPSPLFGVVATLANGIERNSIENGQVSSNPYSFGHEGLVPPNGSTSAYTCEAQLILAALRDGLTFPHSPITPKSIEEWTNAARTLGINLPHDLQFRGQIVDLTSINFQPLN